MWYLARGSGFVSLVLLSASVVLGIVTTARWSNERWPRFTLAFVHRNVSLLAVAFIGAHVATVVVDGFAPVGWKDAVVPFVSPYRALWLGLGTLAFDLAIAVVVTSLLRRRIGARTWHAVHWLSYPLWALAVLHGLGTGTDTHSTVFLLANAACVATVVGAVWWRCFLPDAKPVARGVALSSAVILPAALVVWTVAGPLASGWARRAGTPAALLAGAGSSTAAGSAPARPGGEIGNGYSATFDGTLTQSGAGQQVTLTIDGPLHDGQSRRLHVSIDAQDDGSGSLLVRNGTVRIVDGSGRTAFDGSVSDVRDGVLVASSSTAGTALAIRFDTLDTRGGAASGTVQALGGNDGGRFGR
jgi:sulfoxide reductase heme-binding subunit YedZ